MRIKVHSAKLSPELNMVNVHFISPKNLVLSMGIGSTHYCEARDGKTSTPSNAEFAVFDQGGPLEPLGDDSVRGWVPLSHLPHMLDLLEQDQKQALVDYLTNLEV